MAEVKIWYQEDHSGIQFSYVLIKNFIASAA